MGTVGRWIYAEWEEARICSNLRPPSKEVCPGGPSGMDTENKFQGLLQGSYTNKYPGMTSSLVCSCLSRTFFLKIHSRLGFVISRLILHFSVVTSIKVKYLLLWSTIVLNCAGVFDSSTSVFLLFSLLFPFFFLMDLLLKL